VKTLSEFADCTILVAPEHIPGIRRWQRENGTDIGEFVEITEPRVSRAAKWHRIPWFLLYLNWLRRASRVARALHADRAFDAVYHATYAVYWLPSPIDRFGLPCVWGPVGGAARTPFRLWPLLGWKGLFDEILDLVSVRIGHWLPATRRTWRRVGSALVQNEETLDRMTERMRGKSRVLNHVLFVEPPVVECSRRQSFILFPSSLEVRKGPRLAIQALALTPEDVRMVIASDGPQEQALQDLAKRLGVSKRIDFRGRVPRAELFVLLSQTAATVFTGLREEGGAALAEAMLCGSPVIVLANGGARTVAASATDPSRVRLVQPGGCRGTAESIAAAMTECSRQPSMAEGPTLDQARSRQLFRKSFEQALWTPDSGRSSRRNVADPTQAG
jgi:glycosyltransferase involved in cell wall biosynthesis